MGMESIKQSWGDDGDVMDGVIQSLSWASELAFRDALNEHALLSAPAHLRVYKKRSDRCSGSRGKAEAQTDSCSSPAGYKSTQMLADNTALCGAGGIFPWTREVAMERLLKGLHWCVWWVICVTGKSQRIGPVLHHSCQTVGNSCALSPSWMH